MDFMTWPGLCDQGNSKPTALSDCVKKHFSRFLSLLWRSYIFVILRRTG